MSHSFASQKKRLQPGHWYPMPDAPHAPDARFGTYLFGEFVRGEVVTKYVGRTFANLREEIAQSARRLAEKGRRPTHFAFFVHDSAKAAYDDECVRWHQFGGPQGRLWNEVHPAQPAQTNWRCPVCSHPYR